MPPEVSKLIAAVTVLVSALNESAGVPTAGAGLSGPSDARFDAKKEKTAAAPGLLVRFQEPQMNDRVWNRVAQIFSKNLIEASAKPDYDQENTVDIVPSIIQQTATIQEKTQEGFFSKLMKFLLPVLALVGGIGLSIAALFQGPGVLGNSMNLVGKLLAKYGQNFIEGIGKRLLSLSDDFLKGIGDFVEGKIKYLSNSIDSIGKMLSGMAAKVVSFLPKGGLNLIDNIGKKILSFSDGFLKGIGDLAAGGLKLIGAGGTGSIGKMLGGIASKVGGFLLKVAKRIPYIGSAVSFYFAFQRFQQGDYVGSALEIASGLVNLIPGFGWIGSALIDVVTIARDATTTPEERTGGVGMGIVKMLTNVALRIGSKLLTVLKFVPFIGSAISFYFAYKRFQEGDYIGMALEIVSGIADLIPGAGTAVSWIIDIVNLARDVSTTKEERAGQSGGVKKLFEGIKDFFAKNGLTILRNMPFIGSLMYFQDAYNAGFTTPEGIKNTVKAFGSVMGAGGLIGSAIDSLFALFGEKEEPETASKAPTKSFFQIAKDFIKKAINKLPYALRKPLEWLGIIEKADSDIEGSAVPDLAKKNPVLDRATAFNSEVKTSLVKNDPKVASTLLAKNNPKEISVSILEKTTAFGTEIKNMFQASLPEVKGLGVSILEKTTAFGLEARDMFQASLSRVKEIGTNILEKTTAFGSEIKNMFVASLPKVKEIGSKIFDSITSLARSAKNMFVLYLPKAKEMGSSILDSITSSAKSVKDSVMMQITSISNGLKDKIQKTKNIFSSIIDKISEASNTVIDWVKNILSWVNDKIVNFSKNLLNVFDFDKSSEVNIENKNAEINIKSPGIDAIALYSKRQVELLESILVKMDNISIGSSAPSPSPATGQPMAGNGGSVDRGYSSLNLLPIGTIGSTV